MPFPDPIRHHLDKQSFERIYNQNWAKLYSIALCRLEDEDLAKELVQTIFVSLWERRESLVIAGSVSHYLTRAAIYGTVRSAEGELLPGATISVKENAAGTFSDQNGKFRIEKLRAGKLSVSVSFIGYQSQNQNITVKDGDEQRVDFKLSANATDLEDRNTSCDTA
ncbi:carboxypeptidase-like regulatory domain-containing protein [Dyadobacter fermentans]|uniref:RNA polymerase, sigma-24 subunit, ECF subfamily n=1 Tax=Dyadobacter fermentans (strain ATCC 700827 / DSM 18053 / CIP 107007 / KCTC 52180 / NS114) TaxID=471854 RepID=C6VYV8_DYAFD|nr:carboxypeptidase-like regulatory domain-containing protein [Dyadobacter fermentans]ACT93463.1 RNA polymerase, sigma-24 subunit, ECF subfamily [Dyadobacter fermentans DSM 18053]